MSRTGGRGLTAVPGPVIEVTGVEKRFDRVVALHGVDLAVPRGTVHGLLGHNGAGKSTLINILATQIRPSRGTARVAGYDVVGEAPQVRRRIGLTGQSATLDERISGRDNLVLIARLLGARSRQARARADELLESFRLTDAAKRQARTYSGGMQRRLDLAACLVGRPEVIFLDEPTTGLDPESRLTTWQVVRDVVRDGSTVVLTTQYLEEADRLADTITVLARGGVVASGTPADLKARVGGRTVTVTLAAPTRLAACVQCLRGAGLRSTPDDTRTKVTVPVGSARDTAAIVRTLDDAGIEVAELLLAEPSLDEVYLSLTARPPAEAPERTRVSSPHSVRRSRRE
ncbi:ATP-binding cassette domain-containing protein [Actinomadura macra]|uniref:ATP-binding cassette domain-containing protein n=1 Tax=Actinomadura macra TaxID=46164 RepID=UPI00082C4867|nr:ATP-binding cassette domain-containing protein [Actinomadura macra]